MGEEQAMEAKHGDQAGDQLNKDEHSDAPEWGNALQLL